MLLYHNLQHLSRVHAAVFGNFRFCAVFLLRLAENEKMLHEVIEDKEQALDKRLDDHGLDAEQLLQLCDRECGDAAREDHERDIFEELHGEIPV